MILIFLQFYILLIMVLINSIILLLFLLPFMVSELEIPHIILLPCQSQDHIITTRDNI